MSIHIYIYLCIHVYLYIDTFEYRHIYMRVYAYICLYVYVHICMHTYIYIHIYIDVYLTLPSPAHAFFMRILFPTQTCVKRSFQSISDTWHQCSTHDADVKELIPEFFNGKGDFLVNRSGLELGVTQEGRHVHGVYAYTRIFLRI